MSLTEKGDDRSWSYSRKRGITRGEKKKGEKKKGEKRVVWRGWFVGDGIVEVRLLGFDLLMLKEEERDAFMFVKVEEVVD